MRPEPEAAARAAGLRPRCRFGLRPISALQYGLRPPPPPAYLEEYPPPLTATFAMPTEPHHLRKQVEQIADTTPGSTVSVIVQMPGHEDLSDFLDAAAEAVALRRSTASARALVPPRHDKLAVGAGGHLTPTA